MLPKDKIVLDSMLKEYGPVEIVCYISEYIAKAVGLGKKRQDTSTLLTMRKILDLTAYKLLGLLECPRNFEAKEYAKSDKAQYEQVR